MENAMKKALKEQIRSRPRRKRRPKAWWNQEVDTAVKRRREASRYHRGIVKRGRREEVNRAWDLFRSCKQKAAACIQASIQRCDRRFMEELRRAGKSAPQRFWRRLRWEARSTNHTQILKQPETGAEMLGIQCIPLIEEWYGNMIGAEEPMSVEGDQEIPDVDNKDQGPPAELRVRPTDGELSRAARRVDAKTAMGRDEIPMSLIQGLGPRMRALVAENLTEILADAQVPETWKETRMKLLYKGKGEKADLGNYRPISITSVLYRMCTQIIRTRLQKWAEETEVLGELQNGFRTGRCIEDNLFVVTQCIEVAVQECRPLYAAFLDISKAYDTVDRNILWSRLRGLGINKADVNLLQALYAGVSVRIEWEGHMTRRLPVPRGLKQGFRHTVHRAFQQQAPVDTPAHEEPTLTYAILGHRLQPPARPYLASPRHELPAPQYSRRHKERAQFGLCDVAVQDVVEVPKQPRPRLAQQLRDVDVYLRHMTSP
ncbi:hypothetical protein ISCGN_001910 [Ixodes scapularis]